MLRPLYLLTIITFIALTSGTKVWEATLPIQLRTNEIVVERLADSVENLAEFLSGVFQATTSAIDVMRFIVVGLVDCFTITMQVITKTYLYISAYISEVTEIVNEIE